ncbi:MAG TPA: hypothetical protein VL120_12930 [Solirubrobacteraceae bacterium]|nr:hypothetical protein [Solirubrobacteraceae bacterium]
MRRLAIVLATLFLSLAPVSIATAQIGPQVPAPLTGETTTAAPKIVNPNATDNGGLSTLQLVLIFGSAMAVLAGIAWIILRDAHRAAPVAKHVAAPADRKLTHAERERQERKRREKAKAAKQQRKKNRPR